MEDEILELELMLLSLELESILAVLISVDTWTLNSCTPHSLLHQLSLKSQMCSNYSTSNWSRRTAPLQSNKRTPSSHTSSNENNHTSIYLSLFFSFSRPPAGKRTNYYYTWSRTSMHVQANAKKNLKIKVHLRLRSLKKNKSDVT